MSFIRARQPIMTRLFPHQANRRFLVPSRKTTEQSIPVMGVVAAQSDTQLIAIAPVDMSAFLVSGAPPITWSATGLPTGLSIAAATGIVTGTAPAAAGFNPTITATNAFGADTSASFVWTITI